VRLVCSTWYFFRSVRFLGGRGSPNLFDGYPPGGRGRPTDRDTHLASGARTGYRSLRSKLGDIRGLGRQGEGPILTKLKGHWIGPSSFSRVSMRFLPNRPSFSQGLPKSKSCAAGTEEPARIYRIPIRAQLDLPISYNIAPSQPVLAIRFNPETKQRSLDTLLGGLVPPLGFICSYLPEGNATSISSRETAFPHL
jgi:hypothetical protein